MKKRNQLLAFLGALLLGALLPVAVLANSAEPPCFTVIVVAPPEGITLSLQLSDGTQQEPLLLPGESRAWETYYRFFYHTDGSIEHELPGGTKLFVEYGEESFTCPLPVETFDSYNNLLTLDLKNRTLSAGAPAYRDALLTALRVGLTLLTEGLVFFLFGYRARRSWLVFLFVNLATQAFLNFSFTHTSSISGGKSGGLFLLFLCEFFIFLAETIAFVLLLKEHRHWRAAVCALSANTVSLVLGGLVISYLPF